MNVPHPFHPKEHWTARLVLWLVATLLFWAPVVATLVGMFLSSIENSRADLVVRAELTDPSDAAVGRIVGDYLREMRDTSISSAIDVQKYESIKIYVSPPKDSSLFEKVVWKIPSINEYIHELTKIEIFKSAVQEPSMECVRSLVDSNHGNGERVAPSEDTVKRIESLVSYLEVSPTEPTSKDPIAQSRVYVENKLESCLKVAAGMRNFMNDYFRPESKMTVENPELTDFVAALVKLRTNFGRALRSGGVPCAPKVPEHVQSALDQIVELKAVMIDVQNQTANVVMGNAPNGEISGLNRGFDEAKRKVDKIETLMRGALPIRANGSKTTSGEILWSTGLWFVSGLGIYLAFAHRAAMRPPRPSDGAPPVSPTTTGSSTEGDRDHG